MSGDLPESTGTRAMTIDLTRMQVNHGSEIFMGCRVAFRGGEVAVYVEDGAEAKLVMRASGATWEWADSARDPHIITTADGDTWQMWQRAGGCGCGSPLSRLDIDSMLPAQVSA